MPNRASTRRQSHPGVAKLPDGEYDRARRKERNEFLSLVIGGLPPRDRDALLRFYVQGEESASICKALGITEIQFRLIKSRALKEIRKMADARTPRRPPGTASRDLQGAAHPNLRRAVPVIAHAIAVFGDEVKAADWLTTPLPIFADQSPEQVLSRPGGVRTVEPILTRIEHNIPS